jgi:hypothetical protein
LRIQNRPLIIALALSISIFDVTAQKNNFLESSKLFPNLPLPLKDHDFSGSLDSIEPNRSLLDLSLKVLARDSISDFYILGQVALSSEFVTFIILKKEKYHLKYARNSIQLATFDISGALICRATICYYYEHDFGKEMTSFRWEKNDVVAIRWERRETDLKTGKLNTETKTCSLTILSTGILQYECEKPIIL